MSVTIETDCIRLAGRCLADDAEPLLAAVQEWADLPVDMTDVQKLHLAVVQILLAARPRVIGTPRPGVIPGPVADLVQ